MEKVWAELALFSVEKAHVTSDVILLSVLLQTIAKSWSVHKNFGIYIVKFYIASALRGEGGGGVEG